MYIFFLVLDVVKILLIILKGVIAEERKKRCITSFTKILNTH